MVKIIAVPNAKNTTPVVKQVHTQQVCLLMPAIILKQKITTGGGVVFPKGIIHPVHSTSVLALKYIS